VHRIPSVSVWPKEIIKSDPPTPASIRSPTLGCCRQEAGDMEVTSKIARMNLAIRDFSLSDSNGERVGVRCRIARNADSFRQDLRPNRKADLVPVQKDLAKRPFNMSDWGGENLRQDVRWKFGMPPVTTPTMPGFNISSITPLPWAWRDSSWPDLTPTHALPGSKDEELNIDFFHERSIGN
jgi:hypothetical protein